MSLLMVNKAVKDMGNLSHSFTDKEKEFVLQFAFKTGDKELTNALITELSNASDEAEVDVIIAKYTTMFDDKPAWVSQIENLLISLEMYRIEEEKAINRLADILDAYGIDVSMEEIKTTDTDKLKQKVKEKVMI